MKDTEFEDREPDNESKLPNTNCKKHPCLTNKIKNLSFFFYFRPYWNCFWQNTCTVELKIENSVWVSRNTIRPNYAHICYGYDPLRQQEQFGQMSFTCLISSYDRIKCKKNFTSHAHVYGGLCWCTFNNPPVFFDYLDNLSEVFSANSSTVKSCPYTCLRFRRD